MIKSFTVTNYLGDSIKIELGRPEKSGFLIKSVTGLGPTKANINTTEISTNDGSLFNSSRLNKRNIVFSVVFVDTPGKESIEDIRQKSYKYFPIKKNLELRIETDNRVVKTVGYVEANEPNIFSKQEGAQISIICPDPYFYSIGESITVFSGIDPRFEFPFSNESLDGSLIAVGEILIKNYNNVPYQGDADIGVTMTIHAIGEASNVTIYNIETRETMRINTDRIATLTGSGIVYGDDIIIKTMKGDKSITLVRNGVSTNILNCLEKGSDWISISKGDNAIAFTAEIGTTNLQFSINNKIVYEGI